MVAGNLAARAVRRGRHVLRETRYYAKIGLIGLFRAGPRGGTTIWEDEWDVLVVLDACRPDLLRSFEDEYGFICEPRERRSIASYSRSWMRRTFGRRYASQTAETAYITGNPFSGEVLDGDRFAHLDEVWRDAWDPAEGTVLPRPITDRAIRYARENDPERLIVHYMQPHHPFVTDETRGFDPGGFPNPRTADPWDQVRRGQRDLESVVAAYRDNLAYVLRDVDLLLANVDADTAAITADHANATGEHGIYGHPAYGGIDAVRCVPWCVTEGTDTESYQPGATVHEATDTAADDPMTARTPVTAGATESPPAADTVTDGGDATDHDPDALLRELGYR